VVVTNTTYCPNAYNNGTSLFKGILAGNGTINWNNAQSWMCTGGYSGLYKGFSCGPGFLALHADDWLLTWPCVAKVEYCLSEGVYNDADNEMQFSVPIMILVCVLNFVKVVGISCTFYIFRQPLAPLVTVGDAIASFCDIHDETTKGLCWLSSGGSYENDSHWPKQSHWERWRSNTTRWHAAVSSWTYYSTIVPYVGLKE
jgi:hypothetical protein